MAKVASLFSSSSISLVFGSGLCASDPTSESLLCCEVELEVELEVEVGRERVARGAWL